MGARKIMVTEYTCERCAHVWQPRGKAKPKVCPKCKRFDWDESKPPKGGRK